jgi:shikimate dehydrogenase
MTLYGLIGYPLSHSFSKKYFTEKFVQLGVSNLNHYDLYELATIDLFPTLIKENEQLKGLNVTIPHKQNVIPFLDSLDESAQKVGAVNVIKRMSDGTLRGYNSDYYGFKGSLCQWLESYQASQQKALVLGNGGAAKAVFAALDDLEIPFQIVSRQKTDSTLSYADLSQEIMTQHTLIINASPVGTYPNVEHCPAIPYQYITDSHFLYDLVYNPEETLFMTKGIEQGAKAKNGLEMLILQAEKAWEIWNSFE